LLAERHGALLRRSAGPAVDAAGETLPETVSFSLFPRAPDVRAFVEAAEALSTGLVRGDLVAKLMSITMRNAGARRGEILLERDGAMVLAAEANELEHRVRQVVVPPQPAGGLQSIPWTIVNYAFRTRETVLLGDTPETWRKFAADPYIV